MKDQAHLPLPQIIRHNQRHAVTLLDGSYYLITYEQTPGYGATYTTGRITSLQVPAGATIHYTYPASQPNDDINCGTAGSPHDGAGRTLELDRQTPDGTTTYTASPASDKAAWAPIRAVHNCPE